MQPYTIDLFLEIIPPCTGRYHSAQLSLAQLSNVKLLNQPFLAGKLQRQSSMHVLSLCFFIVLILSISVTYFHSSSVVVGLTHYFPLTHLHVHTTVHTKSGPICQLSVHTGSTHVTYRAAIPTCVYVSSCILRLMFAGACECVLIKLCVLRTYQCYWYYCIGNQPVILCVRVMLGITQSLISVLTVYTPVVDHFPLTSSYTKVSLPHNTYCVTHFFSEWVNSSIPLPLNFYHEITCTPISLFSWCCFSIRINTKLD